MQTDPAAVKVSSAADARTVSFAHDILRGDSRRKSISSILPFLGPAFIAAIAYVDPGNFATNIQSGAKYGYLLLWVIGASNLMALLVQSLSAKLGIATGKNLAQLCREGLRRPAVYAMWILMEVVALATDLAEFLGAALGFSLLLNIPVIYGAIIAVAATFAILGLERFGFRPLEAAIGSLLAVIAGSYIIETFLDRPDLSELAHGILVPGFAGTESIILAAGILGATVMPHAVFLHSGLTQGRIVMSDPKLKQKLYRYELIDCIIAMGIAGFVNGAMLIMSAATFHRSGITDIGTIQQAHKTLTPLLGQASSWVFAISLIASGLSSTAVGTMSGQLVMQGFIGKKIPLWLRRAVTIVPTFAVVGLGFDPTRTLVLSQVILSFALPFALIPLVRFTADKKIMGFLVNKTATTIAGTSVTAVVIVLNAYLLFNLLS